jgi:lantibiotic modifying enzyme
MYKQLIANDDPRYARLEQQVQQIWADLQTEQALYNNSYGILGGKAGIALFYGYTAMHYNQQQYYDPAYAMLEDMGDALATQEMIYTMSAGIGGIAYTFQHLQNIGLIDSEDDLNLAELDDYLMEGAGFDRQQRNWDPLHGFVALGVYFLERHKKDNQSANLEKLVDFLWEIRENFRGNDIWMTFGYQDVSRDNYNLGMAHGIPGIISFLAQVHGLGIAQEKTLPMIEQAINFFEQSRYPDNDTYLFPTMIEKENPDETREGSRLGWCYGDLCVALAMIHCGKHCNNKAWYDSGVEMALVTTKRDIENAWCRDACICHGSVGLVHQFNRLWQLTGDDAFKTAALFWLDHTFDEYYKEKEGIGGYFYFHYDSKTKESSYVKSPSLLEGSAGIGLVYLSLITSISPDWDSIFFTNV